VFTKLLLSAAIVLGAALGIATPAGADPSVFGTLSCCEDQVTGAEGGGTQADQVNAGIASALVDLQGISG
jgi:hypothetical protein